MCPAPNHPNAVGGAWRARPNGSISRAQQLLCKPAIREVLSPMGPELVMFGSRALPPAAAPRPRPAVAAPVAPRAPVRRVTFAPPVGGACGALAEPAPAQQQPQLGANSVADIAGVASWLRSRRLNANKEQLRIKIAVNSRRFSSVQWSVSGTNPASAASSGRRQGLRRFSSIAAIDADKVPPTVGPPPPAAASDGAGCTAATSAAAVALQRCCREGDEAALHRLVTGADGLRLQPSDVNSFDPTGRTAVSHVASSGSLAMLEALAQFPGVDFNFSDNEGNTPLHFAAQAGHVEVLNMLLSRCSGVEVDARNSLGFTPLMKAALQGRTKCAKLLLFAGASPALRDLGRGLRAEQWARYCGRHMCAEVIDKFSRHRMLERTGAAAQASAGGRWGSEPELSAQACPAQPAQPAAHAHAHSGGSWLKSKLKRAFKSSGGGGAAEASAPKAAPRVKHQQQQQQEQSPPSGGGCGTPPMTPRVFIVPKVQVTPAGAAEAAAAAEPVAANARRKK